MSDNTQTLGETPGEPYMTFRDSSMRRADVFDYKFRAHGYFVFCGHGMQLTCLSLWRWIIDLVPDEQSEYRQNASTSGDMMH